MQDKILSLIQKMTTQPQKIKQALRAIQIIVGLFLVIYSSQIGRKNFELIVYGRETVGKIVDFELNSMSKNNSSKLQSQFLPVVEFQTKVQLFRFTDYVSTNSSGGINSEVPVLYDSNRPEIAMIKRPVMNWVPWAPMLAMGLVMVLAAFFSTKEENEKS
jgi:hypothetical protein